MHRILRLHYHHITLLKSLPFPSIRHPSADTFITNHKWPNIHTYHELYLNPTSVFLTLSQQQQTYIHSTYNYQMRYVAWTKKLGHSPYRIDDGELIMSIDDKKLSDFVREGLKQKKQHHKLLFWIVMTILIGNWMYWGWWHGTQDESYVANETLNPERLEGFTVGQMRKILEEFKRKMGVELGEIQGKEGK